MADDPAKREYEANKAAAERSKKEGAEKLSKGKPTPTQDENDRARLGEYIPEHEDDGSGPDPYAQKNLEAQEHAQRGGYQTRHVSPSGGTVSGAAPRRHEPSRSE